MSIPPSGIDCAIKECLHANCRLGSQRRTQTLVVGEHAIHELAKTFTSRRPNGAERAATLFWYFGEYAERGVPIIKPNWALLIEEALQINGDAGPVEILLTEETHRAILRAHVDELISKRVSPEIQDDVRNRVFASQDHTESMKLVLARETALTDRLRKVGAAYLEEWVTSETNRPIGIECLQIQLRTQFPQNTDRELWNISARLLDRPRYRVSRALTRTTLYSLWRCANYGTVPKDFNDDTLHLTNASYCDFFATADPQHEQQRAEIFDTCRLLLCSESMNLLESLPLGIRELEASKDQRQSSA